MLLRDLNRKGQTILHVTHDYEEAIALGNRIAVMYNGTIEQLGTPKEVFGMPTSSFVAGFGGVRNFFSAVVSHVTGCELKKANLNGNLSVSLYSDDEGKGYITFPENAVVISETPYSSSIQNTFKGTIIDLYPSRYGFEVVVNIGVKAFAILTGEAVQNLKLVIGKEIFISFKASSVRFIKKI